MKFFNLNISKREILIYFLDLVYAMGVLKILGDFELESNCLKASHYLSRVKIQVYEQL